MVWQGAILGKMEGSIVTTMIVKSYPQNTYSIQSKYGVSDY